MTPVPGEIITTATHEATPSPSEKPAETKHPTQASQKNLAHTDASTSTLGFLTAALATAEALAITRRTRHQ